MRAARSVALKLTLSAAATIALFCVLEAGARRLALPSRPFVVPTSSNCLQRSRTLGMEFVPNCSATWSDEILTGKASTSFRTNALGLRDNEIENDGAVRILALGDSCTWGWEVSQDDTYPRELQRLLDQRDGAQRYRVINAGVPGYTSYQGLIFLREVGLTLHPAIVIIGFFFNDASPLPDIEASLAHQRTLFPLIRIDDVLLAHSALWRWLRTQLDRSATTLVDHSAWSSFGAVSARADSPGEPMVRVAPARFIHNLTAMVNLSRRNGAHVLLLSFAGPPRPEQPYADAMGKVARAMNVPLVVYNGPRIDVIHPAREGEAALAAALFERLETVGYLGATAPKP